MKGRTSLADVLCFHQADSYLPGVYLPADIHDVTEIHFTTVTTNRPNPVTE